MLEGRTALDLPHVGAKPPTVPEPFALKTDQRAAEHDPAAGPVFVFGAAGGEGGRVTRNRAQGAAKPGAAAGGSAWAGGITQPEPFRLATDARG